MTFNPFQLGFFLLDLAAKWKVLFTFSKYICHGKVISLKKKECQRHAIVSTKRPNMKFAPAVRATVQYMGSTVRFAEDATIFQTLGACMPLDGIWWNFACNTYASMSRQSPRIFSKFILEVEIWGCHPLTQWFNWDSDHWLHGLWNTEADGWRVWNEQGEMGNQYGHTELGQSIRETKSSH